MYVKRLKFHKPLYIAATYLVAAISLLSCEGKEETLPAMERSLRPSLHAKDVKTLVSDSGVVRYRVNTDEWFVYDKAEKPYWEFPIGLRLERFDPAKNVDAELQSKYAHYLTDEKLWDLRDSVNATNLEGEHFECDQLFWDERAERIYSNGKIKITKKDRVIYGQGFESNQTLTKYTIRKPEGIFPIKE